MCFYLRRHELNAIDQLLVTIQLLDNFAQLEVPNYNLSVFTRTGDKPIAFTDVNICDVIKMSV